MTKSTIVVVLLFCTALCSFGKIISPPKSKVEEVIENVYNYIQKEKIDVSRHFLGHIEYKNLHNEYQKPYWKIKYIILAGTSEEKFQLYFFVSQEGKVFRAIGDNFNL
jgi:hypothetical protein